MVVYCKDLDLGVPGPNAQCYKWLFTPTPSPPPARVSPGRRPPDWQTQESWSHSCWHSEHFKPSHIPILFSRGQKCHSSLIEVVKCPADSLPVWSVIQDISNDILNRWIALVLQQQSTCIMTITIIQWYVQTGIILLVGYQKKCIVVTVCVVCSDGAMLGGWDPIFNIINWNSFHWASASIRWCDNNTKYFSSPESNIFFVRAWQ